MKKNIFVIMFIGLIFVLLLLVITTTADVPAKSTDDDPELKYSACVYHCMMEQDFIHSKMNNYQSASNAYYAFMRRFWRNSSCEDIGIIDILEVAIAVSGAPGGASMSCYQLLLAQTLGCKETCLKAQPANSAYGANVNLTAKKKSPGYLEVGLENRISDGEPKYISNGYSGPFYLTTTLQLNEGTRLVVDRQEMPNMSFPNWITSQSVGAQQCPYSDAECPSCCRILRDLDTPSYVSTTVEFLDGVLYDLTDQVSNKKGVTGSFNRDGYVILEGNGDTLTINQGPYAGVKWTKVHNKSKDTHTQSVQYWDASSGKVTIVNSECWWCIGNRTEADTYIFALSGPPEKRLPGTYTVESVADVFHDKNFSNNRISYSYTKSGLGDSHDPSGDDDGIDKPKIDISTLPIIDIPGEGVYNYTILDDAPGMMFRLNVPEDVHHVNFRQKCSSGGALYTYVNPGSIPVPEFPSFSQNYTCEIYPKSDYAGECYLINTYPEPYYIFVPSPSDYGWWLGHFSKSFSLEVEFMTKVSATATASVRQTKQAATQQASIRTFTEVEPNDTKQTANEWDMIEPFSGQLTVGDWDYIGVTFSEPGIYTFGITEVSPETKVFLGLITPFGGFVEQATSKNKGEGVNLTFDASAGEHFYFKVYATLYNRGEDGTYYTLELLDFVPDPFEPNDRKTEATDWDISQGPIEGYFWDKAYYNDERADYYRFTAPVTTDGSAVTFHVSNPSAEISICMSLRDQRGVTVFAPPCFEKGADASLVHILVPGQEYYIRLYVYDLKTSLQPYRLSATYIGDGNGTGLSEIEPNDDKQNANPWDMQEPFKGVLSKSSDWDYILVDISTPGIYTFSITDVSPNLKVGLSLVGRTGALHSVQSLNKGQGVSLTMDGSAGEQYWLKVTASQWASDGSFYQLALTDFIPDPGEPNDQKAEATYWDIDEGPIQGYFWEKTHWSMYRADYYKFIAPLTEGGDQVTFQVANPGSDISVCMNLLDRTGGHLLSGECSAEGEDAFLTSALTAGMEYYLKLFTVDNKASLQPYTLSIAYTPGEADDLDESSRLIRLHGFVYRQRGLLPLPIANVSIYAHISGQPAFLLDTTNWLGTYSSKVMLADGQQVTIWAELPGTNFSPEEDVFIVEAGLRHHRSTFSVIGGQLIEQTPTPSPEPTGTPEPPLENPTGTNTPEFLEEKEEPTDTPTATLSPTFTVTLSPTLTDTPKPPTSQMTKIIGKVWRLFERSGPAGVAMAEVILSINGVDQPAAVSQIDGLYMMDVEGIQPGDVLRLRAQAPQDNFEPLYYEWQAEVGVNRWEYDFYSYWDQITPPSTQNQNRIWGTVWDQFGGDVSGLYLNLQMGTSDAIQRIGPTDENGNFEATVTLPDRTMVTVWVDAPGYVPSKLLFFHAYKPENRELIFWKYRGENLQ